MIHYFADEEGFHIPVQLLPSLNIWHFRYRYMVRCVQLPQKAVAKYYWDCKFSETVPIYLQLQQASQQGLRSVLANRLHSYRINTASLCKTGTSIALISCHSLKHFKGCQEADWHGMLPVHLPRKVSSMGSPAGLGLSRERTSDCHLLKRFKHYSKDYLVSADFKKPLSSIRSGSLLPYMPSSAVVL